MRSVKLRSAVLLVFFLLAACRGVRAEEATGTSKILKALERIQTRLAVIEENQQKILETQSQLLEGQHQLRIWVRRS